MKKLLFTLAGLIALIWLSHANAISICTLAACPTASPFEPVFSHRNIDGHGSSVANSPNEIPVLPLQYLALHTGPGDAGAGIAWGIGLQSIGPRSISSDNIGDLLNIAELNLPIDFKLTDFNIDSLQKDNSLLATFELYADTLLEGSVEASYTMASIDFISDDDHDLLSFFESHGGDIITAQQSSIPKPYVLALISLGLVGLGFTQRVLYASA